VGPVWALFYFIFLLLLFWFDCYNAKYKRSEVVWVEIYVFLWSISNLLLVWIVICNGFFKMVLFLFFLNNFIFNWVLWQRFIIIPYFWISQFNYGNIIRIGALRYWCICILRHWPFWWMNECLVIEWILECFMNIGVHHPYGYCTK
jgi:hypothetical protein